MQIRQDAFAEAGGIGIDAASAVNYSAQKTSGGILAASANVSRMRNFVASGEQVQSGYTDEERNAVK